MLLLQIIQLKKQYLKNCAPFTDCMNEIINAQEDNAEYIDIVIPMYSLIEHNDIYSKISGSLWKYCKDISALL